MIDSFGKILIYTWIIYIYIYIIDLALCDGIPSANDAELWWFHWSASNQTVEQTIEMPVIWDDSALIMTSLKCWITILNILQWRHMSARACQITRSRTDSSKACTILEQRKHESSASQPVLGEFLGDWYPHNGPAMGKAFPCHDNVIGFAICYDRGGTLYQGSPN